MFQKVGEAEFVRGEHEMLRFWQDRNIFRRLREQNAGRPTWSFLDGPITANNPMGVHHAWGRTYKDAFQRYWAMNGRELRYQNGFDCQGLWVEVEVEKQLGLGAKSAIEEFGVDKFVWECKKRVLKYAAIQTEQSIRLGYWMEWDDPAALRALGNAIGTDEKLTITTPRGELVTGTAEEIVARLGNPDWGGSYFTFSTENNETIWTFLKKCFQRGKVYRGHDVMPWSGKGGSAYSQMEVADGRKLTTHRALFVRFPITAKEAQGSLSLGVAQSTPEYLLIWTTTPWTLTSNVAAMVNPELDYVKIQTKRDGAIYYFAKDNLDFQRLAKEFKEGFGRPEWTWPQGVPKLKTLSQIFKEQGGYETLGVIKGAEMIGWRYQGPFDDLPAQGMPGGYPLEAQGKLSLGVSGIDSHRVIDGGRDFKGSPNVVAGEGTGIVHSAPGCGDIDHQIGLQVGLPSIAPLREDGTFGEGFGPFTGKVATAPETVDLVIEELKHKHLLVAVEQYPHIYPFCWRTGDELVFRLVDEWFINMDWRDEIMDVTRQIQWLPDSIQGQERELEWLGNMRDWMISKKRFWGLALPIWINPDDPSDFEVIGSLAELKERAVEGWNDFAGHTPHKPWIDGVKIKSAKTGAVLSRIPDVGNPWLDAGIVPFSTLGFNTHPDYWKRWYPADLVTECFPGQFRNWFYSMLALSTMMQHGRCDDPAEKKPFKTLLGHRLVMNEAGKPMHKSDGTAIWFEEAAEQLGVDTMRWLYLQQNPAQDLRFGTRHPEKKVTLQTVDGPKDTTIDGVPTCLVESGPADEVRRQVLLPLWNSYGFFVNYARLDEFDPRTEPVPFADRPQIDQWIVTRLADTTYWVRKEMEGYNTPGVCESIAKLIDDLSNWYIRRNRKRFWRSKDANDRDKLAAYQTLHQALIGITKLMAPLTPFLAERMYQNLVRSWDASAPESVHLCAFPKESDFTRDMNLLGPMERVQQIVTAGHRLREAINQRVRQPLTVLRVASPDLGARNEIEYMKDVIADELNVKTVTVVETLSDIVSYCYRANPASLGKKHGKLLGKLRELIPSLPAATMQPLHEGQPIRIAVDGTEIELLREDVSEDVDEAPGWKSAAEGDVQIALSTALTPELIREGMARDFVRQIQQMRKDAGLEIEQRIRITYATDAPEARAAIAEWSDYIRGETLADGLTEGDPGAAAKDVRIGDCDVRVSLTRAG
jgi:isoleucyl-tRNA synthetase